MTAIVKLVKAIMMLAALVTSVETLLRIARFAWAIVIKLGELLRRRSMMNQVRMNFTG